MLWKKVNHEEEGKKKNASNTEYILIVYYKVMSSQCVLLLPYLVNTGEGTQMRGVFPMRAP